MGPIGFMKIVGLLDADAGRVLVRPEAIAGCTALARRLSGVVACFFSAGSSSPALLSAVDLLPFTFARLLSGSH